LKILSEDGEKELIMAAAMISSLKLIWKAERLLRVKLGGAVND